MPVFFRALEAPAGAALARPWPWRWRCGLVLALYAAYLPWSGADQLPFDAGEYWGLAATFFKPGLRFSLLHYAAPLRGYLGPLLLVPGRVLCYATGWPAVAGAQVLGVLWATLLFGVAGPAAWAAATGRALRGGAWLLSVALGFVFWRGYFSYSLQDAPALALLLLALAALARPGWRWAALGGLLLAATLNLRPIYLASVPGTLGWLWWRGRGAGRGPTAGRWVALAAGAALVLLPQAAINYTHFGQATPLVLATDGGRLPLYLKKLNWGMTYQRYESSIDPAHWGSAIFADPAGMRLMQAAPNGVFNSYREYAWFAVRHPLAVGACCARHLFNGLDVWYPTPYPYRLHPLGLGAAQLLNYAVLALGLAQLLRRSRRAAPGPGAGWALLALGLPVALVIPTLMECRYLLPLHLLLLTAAADGFRPRRWWALPWRRQALALALLAALLSGGWYLSAATARQLQPGDVPAY
ncbi:hypothetical protein ACFQ48_17840 [Hymenobacter caeli]|uniref:Glycosyltransferase RgtA/B/C/D-like domain-containing protein n=1 Tax=Hymenobacter caeli TaxID=2735894 RepID=A0ABX2FWW2_9BACT|nr:hypothetical protein [Hymenobacter caeli]NRT20931.1 hypothetical protein [Hymenobacter caeli]